MLSIFDLVKIKPRSGLKEYPTFPTRSASTTRMRRMQAFSASCLALRLKCRAKGQPCTSFASFDECCLRDNTLALHRPRVHGWTRHCQAYWRFLPHCWAFPAPGASSALFRWHLHMLGMGVWSGEQPDVNKPCLDLCVVFSSDAKMAVWSSTLT